MSFRDASFDDGFQTNEARFTTTRACGLMWHSAPKGNNLSVSKARQHAFWGKRRAKLE